MMPEPGDIWVKINDDGTEEWWLILEVDRPRITANKVLYGFDVQAKNLMGEETPKIILLPLPKYLPNGDRYIQRSFACTG